MSKSKGIIMVSLAVTLMFGFGSATASAEVNCGSFRTHYKRANCYRQMQQVYRNQQRTYQNNARSYDRLHRRVGRVLPRRLRPAWNGPRYINQGYNRYRRR